MFGELLESKARRQRRTGGAALSVAAHVAIVGTITAFTVPRPPAPKPRVDVYHVVISREPPKSETPARRTESRAPRVGPFTALVDVQQLPVPVITSELPPIDVTHGFAPDSLVARGGSPGGGPLGHLGRLDLSDSTGSNEWRGNEALMRVVTQSKPRYPESLRQAAIDGRVLVQFKVDTLGRIDPASVTILSSTHDLFSRAVRDALGGFRFRPAEVNGRRVVALAEMPFEFSIQR
jgi:protein TonB